MNTHTHTHTHPTLLLTSADIPKLGPLIKWLAMVCPLVRVSLCEVPAPVLSHLFLLHSGPEVVLVTFPHSFKNLSHPCVHSSPPYWPGQPSNHDREVTTGISEVIRMVLAWDATHSFIPGGSDEMQPIYNCGINI